MENTNTEKQDNKFPIVGAIIVAAVIIGSAVIYTQKTPESNPVASVNQPTQEENTNTKNLENPENLWDLINPISENDHILGNPSAELSLFLYFDINCGHCKHFHETLTQFVSENNNIKIIPRHFPLNQVSQKEAEATECVAEIAGEEKFTEFLNNLMTNSIQPESMADLENKLTTLAEKMGINKNKFSTCLAEGKYIEKITQSRNEIVQIGVEGTPFSIITDSKGEIEKVIAIPGALEHEDLVKLVESRLEK